MQNLCSEGFQSAWDDSQQPTELNLVSGLIREGNVLVDDRDEVWFSPWTFEDAVSEQSTEYNLTYQRQRQILTNPLIVKGDLDKATGCPLGL